MSVIRTIKGFINRRGEKISLPTGGQVSPYDDTELRSRIATLENAMSQMQTNVAAKANHSALVSLQRTVEGKANATHTHSESDVMYLERDLRELRNRVLSLESLTAVAVYSMTLPNGECEFDDQDYLIDGRFDFVMETLEPVTLNLTGYFYNTAPDGPSGSVGDYTVEVPLSQGHNIVNPSSLLWEAIRNTPLYGQVDTLGHIQVYFGLPSSHPDVAVNVKVYNAPES